MNISTATQLGAAIRDRRKRLGLTQQELAARVGATRRWLVEVERGHPRAELGLVLKTLAALGLRVALEPERAPASTHIPEPPDIDDIVRRSRRRLP